MTAATPSIESVPPPSFRNGVLHAVPRPRRDAELAATTLVVLERGSAWPAIPQDGLDLVALQQEEEETSDAFVARALEAVRNVARRGGTIRHAVLSSSDASSLEAHATRLELARALLRAVLPVVQGRLLLVGRATASSPARVDLLAIADELTEALQGTSATISTLFLPDPARPRTTPPPPSATGVRVADDDIGVLVFSRASRRPHRLHGASR